MFDFIVTLHTQLFNVCTIYSLYLKYANKMTREYLKEGLISLLSFEKIVCKNVEDMTKCLNVNDICTIILVINANSIILKELALVP